MAQATDQIAEQTTDQIRDEIERTREQIGHTVELLEHKANVPARTKTALRDLKESAAEKFSEVSKSLASSRSIEGFTAIAGSSTVRGKVTNMKSLVKNKRVMAFAAMALAGLALKKFGTRNRKAT